MKITSGVRSFSFLLNQDHINCPSQIKSKLFFVVVVVDIESEPLSIMEISL